MGTTQEQATAFMERLTSEGKVIRVMFFGIGDTAFVTFEATRLTKEPTGVLLRNDSGGNSFRVRLSPGTAIEVGIPNNRFDPETGAPDSAMAFTDLLRLRFAPAVRIDIESGTLLIFDSFALMGSSALKQ